MPLFKQWNGESWVPASVGSLGYTGSIGYTGSVGEGNLYDGVVNLEDYGAIADANYYKEADGLWYSDAGFTTLATDNSTALHNAIDALELSGGIVFIGPGRYSFSTGQTLATGAYKGVKIQGVHKTSTILVFAGGTNSIAFTATTAGCLFSNFTILGKPTQLCGFWLHDVYSPGTALEEVIIGNTAAANTDGFGSISNDGAGVIIDSARYVELKRCNIGGNYHGVKQVESSSSDPSYVCQLIDCNIGRNNGYGLKANNVVDAFSIFGGAIQFNTLGNLYSVVTGQQIKLIGTHLEEGGFYISGGNNLKLHPNHVAAVFLDHDDVFYDTEIYGVQGIDLQGFVYTGTYAPNIKDGVQRLAIDSACSNVRLEGKECKVLNLIEGTNEDFETAPEDAITLAGWFDSQVSMETTTDADKHKRGSRGLKVTANVPSTGTAYIRKDIENWEYYKGKIVTFGFWAKCASGNVGTSALQIHDGVSNSQITLAKDDTWHWYVVSRTVDANATHLWLYAMVIYSSIGANNTDYFYIDDCRFNVGGQNKLLGFSYISEDIQEIATKTTSYIATIYDGTLLMDATSGALIVTLPSASLASGRKMNIKKIDSSANTITVQGYLQLDGETRDTIEGDTSVIIQFQNSNMQLQSNGTQWYII